MLNFAFCALKDKGQVGAVELTWRNDPSRIIKESFSKHLAEPLINVSTKKDWISNFNEAGFQETYCGDIKAMNIRNYSDSLYLISNV